jgi:hypothetical protein
LNWDETTFWRTYIMLTDLEGVFRSFESELGLRPIYHHTEARVDGHLFITVLAYQFVQIIRKCLAPYSWPLAAFARHPQRSTARHRDLPSRRWLDAAWSHPRGIGTTENLSSPQHQSSAGRCEKDARIREAARNNLPTSLALPFDRLRTSDRLRERSMGKLFPAGSLT